MFTKGTAPQRLNETSADKRAPLGSMFVDDDGRVWRYARAGATALVGGELVQSNVTYTTSHICGKTTTAPRTGESANKGSQAIGFTTTTTSVADNAFAEGYVGQATSTSAWLDQVSGHAALTASTAGDVRFKRNLPVTQSVGSVRGFLYPNPYDRVVIAATSLVKPPVGIPQWEVEANYYFWLLVRGVGMGRRQGTPVEGQGVIPSATTAGHLSPWTIAIPSGTDAAGGTATPAQGYPVGYCIAYASGATHGVLVFLNLP